MGVILFIVLAALGIWILGKTVQITGKFAIFLAALAGGALVLILGLLLFCLAIPVMIVRVLQGKPALDPPTEDNS